MRMRRKPWARPELDACPYFIKKPADWRNKWATGYARPHQPLHLELGCGKGRFIAQLAPQHPEINYLAIDIKSEVLAVARREIQAAYSRIGLPVDNLLLTAQEIELIHGILGENDVVERLYINFCNPWPKAPYHKKRLTHPKQLVKYAGFLADGAEVWFKTDDDGLFADSLAYFAQCGFTVTRFTYNLHADSFLENITTEHEERFVNEGIPIKFLIAHFDRQLAQAAIAQLLQQNEKYRLRQILTGEEQRVTEQ